MGQLIEEENVNSASGEKEFERAVQGGWSMCVMKVKTIRKIELEIEGKAIVIPAGEELLIRPIDESNFALNDNYFEREGKLIQILKDDYVCIC